jgi:hypothetical protein
VNTSERSKPRAGKQNGAFGGQPADSKAQGASMIVIGYDNLASVPRSGWPPSSSHFDNPVRTHRAGCIEYLTGTA